MKISKNLIFAKQTYKNLKTDKLSKRKFTAIDFKAENEFFKNPYGSISLNINDIDYYKNYSDLRSDTKTIPTKKMRESVMDALLGDDSAFEDKTVQKLERKLCEMFNFKYALFCPTGTIANTIGIFFNSQRNSTIILGDRSHLNIIEKPQMEHNQINTLPLENLDDGSININKDYLLRELKLNLNEKTDLSTVVLENSHNFCGGQVFKKDFLSNLKSELNVVLKELNYINPLGKKLMYHLDGSRILNSSVAVNEDPSELSKGFDTLNLCLSKGLGAPAGSVLLLNNNYSETDYVKLRKTRLTFVGTYRQVGFLAAPALVALEDYKERFKEDHKNAKLLENYIVKNTKKVFIKKPCMTNIVNLYLKDEHCKYINDIVVKCREKHKLLITPYKNYLRLVFHHQVNEKQTIEAGKHLTSVLEDIIV